MPYTLIIGVLGSVILVAGAAWPEKKGLSHPIKSVKNWLFAIGGLFMLAYALLGYIEGGHIFFVFLEILLLITSILMMLNTDDRIDIAIISIASIVLIVWSLTLFEGYQTILFIAGLASIGFGYAFKMGTLRRSFSLALGSLLVAIFSYIETNWIFFWLNLFFMIFSSYYLLITLSYQKALIIAASKNPYKTTLKNIKKAKTSKPKTVSFKDIKDNERLRSLFGAILQKNNNINLYNKFSNNEPLLQNELNILDKNRIELNKFLFNLNDINKFLSPDIINQLKAADRDTAETINSKGEERFKSDLENNLFKLFALDNAKFTELFENIKTVYENENEINILNDIILETCERYDIDLNDINKALMINNDFERDKVIEKIVKRVSIFGRLRWSTQKGLAELDSIVSRLDKRKELEETVRRQNINIYNLSTILKTI